MNDIRFFVNGNIPWDGVDIFIEHDGAWVNQVQCVQVREGECPPVAMRLTTAQAQDLMDRLYQAGFRPTFAKGSEAAAAATVKHLEDMRAIAFNCLEIARP
jgi:hypothetical protein